MGLREKLRDFGSKIVRAFKKKPKIDHDTIQRWKDSGAFSHRVGDDVRSRPVPLTPEQKAALQKQNNILKGGGN